jgi:hypothetical protein
VEINHPLEGWYCGFFFVVVNGWLLGIGLMGAGVFLCVGDLKRKVWGIIFLGFYAPFIV